MFELTNEQRKCFALSAVSDSWDKVELIPVRDDPRHTYLYFDKNKIVKMIQVCEDPGNESYREIGLNETVSEDREFILPKTKRGKPVKLTTANVEKRASVGMAFVYGHGDVCVLNTTADQKYYSSYYEGTALPTFEVLVKWIDQWCADTGEEELEDIIEFAQRSRVHKRINEGDFFRFRINRKLYGYGRILLDFDRMRKENVPFWEIFMGKPLCVGIYHIVTERADVAVDELVGLQMLPSSMIMDNIFYYGECEIIGNREIEYFDGIYPIHYGKSISRLDPDCVMYQCGKTYLRMEGGEELYSGFRNGRIGWNLKVRLPMLLKCIEQKSNAPYWEQNWHRLNEDLRNPKFHKELSDIKKQFGIE